MHPTCDGDGMKPTSQEGKSATRRRHAPGGRKPTMLYRGLFEFSEVSLWEEDASEVRAYLEGLKRSGINDIRTYLDYHPEEVAKCAAMVKVMAVNSATLDLYEASNPDELISNLDKVLGEESYELLKRILIAIAEGQTEFEADALNRTLKGRKKHFLMRWKVAPGFENTYERVWIEMTDLTEHEHFARELDDTDRRYKMLAEYVNDVIWTMDMGLEFTFVSPSVERALGYTVEEMLGLPYHQLLTPASLEVAMAAIAEELAPEAMRKRDPRRSRVLELEFIRKNGSRMWGELNISFMLDRDNLPSGLIGVVRDITDRCLAKAELERKEAEERLQDSEAGYRAIFEMANDGILIHDADTGRILDVNNRTCELFGYSRKQMLDLDIGAISGGGKVRLRRTMP